MDCRAYHPERDKEAARRIWREIGWLEKEREKESVIDEFLAAGRAWVAELDGSVECLVSTGAGTIRYLDADAPWRGVAGEYAVTFGPESSAEPGREKSLPVMEASVGAFTRMWMGVGSPSGVSISDDLTAPPELLARLDGLLHLPPPKTDWEF